MTSGTYTYRVLIVEDHLETRTYLRMALSDTLDVSEVANAVDALNAIDAQDFDLLLIDIALGSRMTGKELLTHLRQTPPYDEVPIVAMTAHHHRDNREEYLRHGFDAYLAKPFFPEELHRILARLLGDDTDQDQPSP